VQKSAQRIFAVKKRLLRSLIFTLRLKFRVCETGFSFYILPLRKQF